MFMGEYRHNIDSKNRLIIPAKYREELGENFIITRGIDKCLNIYTQEQWNRMFEELNSLPGNKLKIRQYVHNLTSKASECALDSMGRIKVPSFLTSLANIQKECVIVGENTYLSVWAAEEYEIFDSLATEGFVELAEQITEFMPQ